MPYTEDRSRKRCQRIGCKISCCKRNRKAAVLHSDFNCDCCCLGIFNMKYFDDMPYEDIAAILDVAVGTLKATYHNAVKKIEENMRIIDSQF